MVKVTFLGTSDSIPSIGRNHTSILLSQNSENILIDCGEGTQKQFREAKLNPCKVTRILITHWHGDHVLGIPGLLSTLALSGYNKVMYVYGPEGTKKKFLESLKVFPFKRDYDIVYTEISEGRFFENEDFYLESEKMEHGVPCLAYSFTEKGHVRIKKEKLESLGRGPHLKKIKEGIDIDVNGKKIRAKDFVYKERDKKISIVMDTRMNPRILPFVKGSDFFISEGTYSHDMKKEALEHFHLTVKQVSEIAKKANVRKLFITHISSRYVKAIKYLTDEAKSVFNETYLVRDLDFFIL